MGNFEKTSGQFTFKKPLQGGQQHPNPEFILRIDPDAYHDYQRDSKTVPLALVADTHEIYCSRSGSKEGHLQRPSQQELLETFGTTEFAEIVEFMLKNGRWQPYGKHEAIRNPKELSRVK